MKKGKLRVINGGYFAFWCPGCEEMHMVRVGGQDRPHWTFNGNYDAPTFSPSILIRQGHYADNAKSDDCWCEYNKANPDDIHFKCGVCHSFVVDGQIRYLTVCTHALAGHVVSMVDPEDKI